MVNDGAQMYTIEGVAAGVLILVTVYLVISTASLFTPGDSHITDMQLEQIGNDALAMMDTPDTYGATSGLSGYTSTLISAGGIPPLIGTPFDVEFMEYLNKNTTGLNNDHLKYYLNVYQRDPLSGAVTETISHKGYPYYRENSVTVKRWIYIHDVAGLRNQMVLLEVVLWRD